MARGGTLGGRNWRSTSRKVHDTTGPSANKGRQTPISGSVETIRKSKLSKLQSVFANVTLTEMAGSIAETKEPPADEGNDSSIDGGVSNKKSSLKAYGKQLRRAVGMADVVLEVLDARDPEAFRSYPMEQYVIENGKRLVLILNKLDLLDDPALARRWELHLKTQYPVVLFRSMTTSSRSRNSTVNFDRCKASMANSKQLGSGYSPIGASDLMSVLANYTRVQPAGEVVKADDEHAAPQQVSASRSITVCVVGMPNVGKSSVINSLMRNTKHLKTGNEPGITKNMQTVRLTSNIQLVDTPGVVLDSHVSPAEQILRGTLHDFSSIFCDQAIAKLFQDPAKRNAIFSHFSISKEEILDPQQFLARICDDRRLMLSGGRRDLVGARRLVIQSWAAGSINYSVAPPLRSATAGQVTVVAKPSPELDLDNF